MNKNILLRTNNNNNNNNNTTTYYNFKPVRHKKVVKDSVEAAALEPDFFFLFLPSFFAEQDRIL